MLTLPGAFAYNVTPPIDCFSLFYHERLWSYSKVGFLASLAISKSNHLNHIEPKVVAPTFLKEKLTEIEVTRFSLINSYRRVFTAF